MRLYERYTDDQLLDEIEEYVAARKARMMGGIEEVSGEGRRIKYLGTDLQALNRELSELYAELRLRNLTPADGIGAIAVEFR